VIIHAGLRLITIKSCASGRPAICGPFLLGAYHIIQGMK